MKKQLSILQTFLVTCLLLVIGGGSSLAGTYSYTHTDQSNTPFTASSNTATATLNNVNWTVVSSKTTLAVGANSTSGTCAFYFGNKNNAPGILTLSTTGIPGVIKSIEINAKAQKPESNATVSMSVGGVAFTSGGNNSVNISGTKFNKYTFTGESSGEIEIIAGEFSKGYFGINYITITYSAFEFSATTCTAMLGANNNKFPTLLIPNGTSVTYSSSNHKVVSDFKADGTPILKATGETTITAKLDANPSVTASYELTVNQLTNSLSFSADGGTYNKAPQIVTLTAGIEGSKIYYTTNGDEPTTESQLYTDGVSVTKNGTVIKALAVADAVENFTATSEKFTIQPDKAVFSVDSKTFKEPLDVELTLPLTTDSSSKIYYAIGSVPNGESNVYTGTPVRIDSETDGEKIILHARVCDEYGNWSRDSYKTYTKTTAVVFDFTKNPNVWGITPTSENNNSNTDGKDLYVEGVKLNTTSGTGREQTCIFSSSSSSTPNLRVYSGGSLTFTAPLGYNISKIVFTGSASFNPSVGSFSSKTWTGTAEEVTLDRTNSTEIKTASVTLVKVTESISLPATDNGKTFATFSCSRDVIFTKDVNVNAVKVEDGSLVITKLTIGNYQTNAAKNLEGYYVPANTGVLISGTKDNTQVYYPAANQSVTIDNNQLKPAPINGGMIKAVDGNKYYKLAYSDYNNTTGLGFYWGADNGGAFKVKAGTAYLEVPVTSSSAKGFAFVGDETGITNIDANSSNSRVIYNLAGQRMSDTVKPGLYIINGKKTVVR